jgi:hypothetical protein
MKPSFYLKKTGSSGEEVFNKKTVEYARGRVVSGIKARNRIGISLIIVAAVATVLSYIWTVRVSFNGWDISRSCPIGRVIGQGGAGHLHLVFSILKTYKPGQPPPAGDLHQMITGKWIDINPDDQSPGWRWPLHVHLYWEVYPADARDLLEVNLEAPIWIYFAILWGAIWVIRTLLWRLRRSRDPL